jgi:hypothetical protein
MKELTILLLPPQLIITPKYPSPAPLFFDWEHLPSSSKIGGHFFAAIGVLGVEYLEISMVKKYMQTFAFPPNESTENGYSTIYRILENYNKLKNKPVIPVKPQTRIKSADGPRVPLMLQPKVKTSRALTSESGTTEAHHESNFQCQKS